MRLALDEVRENILLFLSGLEVVCPLAQTKETSITFSSAGEMRCSSLGRGYVERRQETAQEKAPGKSTTENSLDPSVDHVL